MGHSEELDPNKYSEQYKLESHSEMNLFDIFAYHPNYDETSEEEKAVYYDAILFKMKKTK